MKNLIFSFRKWTAVAFCIFLCLSLFASCGENPQHETPVTVSYNSTNLSVKLPDGYTYSESDNGDLIFSKGTDIIGGMKMKAAPEGFLPSEYFSQDFLIAFGVQEAADETLGYSGGGNVSPRHQRRQIDSLD